MHPATDLINASGDKMALFGTNGVRGIANRELTPELGLRLSTSLGTFLNGKGTVVVGRDTRLAGEMIKSSVIAGLLSTGVKVIDVGIVPTPSLQNYVKNREDAAAGVIVTASHNPREYIGIKIIASDGTEFSRTDEKKVEEIYESGKFLSADWRETGKYETDPNCNEIYISDVLSKVDVEAIRACRFKVVTDTGCGAGSLTLPVLLQRLGCSVITINAQPDGTFPWRNPEPVEEALTEMSALIRHGGCDLGIAHDGDADRAVFMDENGDFLGEDLMLSAVGKYILAEKKGPIVTPVSSSKMFADLAEEAGVPLYWTAVGSIDVAYKMKEVGAVYGGEGNGGLIFPEHQVCRDGAMSAAKVLDILAKNKCRETGAPMKASDFRKAVHPYVNLKIKKHIPEPKKAVAALRDDILAGRGDVIPGKEIGGSVIDTIDTIDGAKIWTKTGWILIRPSGTEALVRITAEAGTEENARKLLDAGSSLLDRYM